MAHQLSRPLVLDPRGAADPCTICEARTLGLCDAIPDADLARLSSIVVETEVAAGQGFIDQGEPANCFFIVRAGTAKLFKLLPDGRRQITGFVGPGQFLGLAVSGTYAYSAEAIEPVRYCRFQRAALRAVLDDFPQMEKRLLEVASSELVAAQEQMLLLGRKTARERLASFLLVQSRQGMPSGHSRQRFKLPMTRMDIADYLGLTVETVSRTFTRLCAERLIDIVSQSGLVIRDPAALEDLAGGMPSAENQTDVSPEKAIKTSINGHSAGSIRPILSTSSPIRASARSNVADQPVALRLGSASVEILRREGREEETCHMTF